MPPEAATVTGRPLPGAGIVGLRWSSNGQSSLSGPLLESAHALDRLFVAVASRWGAAEHAFPPILSAQALARLDYFQGFPHLVTFPATLDNDEGNLREFQRDARLDATGAVPLTRLAPVRDALTPAVCYHVYDALAGRDLDGPAFVTSKGTCFRREERYEPLRRQWSFAMREVVCVGAEGEVKPFLDLAAVHAEALARRLGVACTWKAATDPFFDPRRSAKWLAQRLDPVKRELVLPSGLAIASANFHRDFFGEAFAVRRSGAWASSGCLAFGVERWLHALAEAHGPDPRRWPGLA